jgi:hypothetical protein
MLAIRGAAILLTVTLAVSGRAYAQGTAALRVPEPRLPVIDHDGCPGAGAPIRHFKIQRDDRLYSSWQGKGTVVATLKAGDEVTILSGLNIVREPDRAVLRYFIHPLDGLVDSPTSSLKPGDMVLRYGLDRDQCWKYWGKGVWFSETQEAVVEKDSRCGFTDESGCTIAIVKNGVKERWLRIRTGDGRTGWVMAEEQRGDKLWMSVNFGLVCHGD